MTRLGRLLGILGIVAVVAALASCNRTTPPPNVLLIVADDLGYNDIGIYNGNTTIRTPSIDTLAREGLRFTRHYADSSCSPSRVALMTGMHPARLGFAPNGRGISPQVTTLAEALREHGYSTMHIGKWHIGDTLREAWPDRQGFDHWFGFLNQWYLPGDHKDGKLVLGEPRYEDPWLMRDGDSGARYPGNLDSILTAEANGQIRKLGADGKPWFINLWFYLPHSPITPAPDFAARWPDTPEGRYNAMLEHLDTNVGSVLRTLEETGQRESTLVILVSDNGATMAKPDSNAPFYGSKTFYFEGGVRTPLIVRWPDGHAADTTDDRLAAIYDLFPTVLHQAGIASPPGINGQDLAVPAERNRDLFWEAFSAQHFGYSVLHQRKWRVYDLWPLARWEVPSKLYDTDDLNSPPRDLAGEMPELREDLDRRWLEWHRRVHRLELVAGKSSDGTAVLSGEDFLRTPGYGGFSFAIPFVEGYAGPLASQAGVWSMSADDGNRVRARLGQWELAGNFPAPAPCHTAIVSGEFLRKVSTLEGARDHFKATLFLDGQSVGDIEVDAKIDDTHFREPTLIGPRGGDRSPPLVGAPILLSAPVEKLGAYPAEDLHAQLCGSLPGKHP